MLKPLDPNEDNAVRLWAEIWMLRSEAKGPGEHETWRDAAVDEKTKRIKAESELKDLREKLRTLVGAS